MLYLLHIFITYCLHLYFGVFAYLFFLQLLSMIFIRTSLMMIFELQSTNDTTLRAKYLCINL